MKVPLIIIDYHKEVRKDNKFLGMADLRTCLIETTGLVYF